MALVQHGPKRSVDHNTKVSKGHLQLCCASSLIPRQLAAGYLISIVELGFPKELGNEIAKTLGSPKAMRRMNSYLYNVKPRSVELAVDEMLAICSEIDVWREKKAGEGANTKYNEMLCRGSGNDEEDPRWES